MVQADNSKLPSGSAQPASQQEQFLERLRKALAQDGDFPTSAKVVGELKRLTTEPNTTANQIAELILREPSLGARVLHVVNSSFYRRSKPIMTISQAVVQIGMKPLAELCAGLVLLQKFGSVARRGHAFTRCLSRTVTSSLLTGSLASKVTTEGSSKDEYGYLVGSLSEMGSLLLAYYFPELYENAAKRSDQRKIPIGQAIQELVGLTPIQLSLEVVSSLKLPDFYRAVLARAAGMKEQTLLLPSHQALVPTAAKVVNCATKISVVITEGGSKEELDAALANVQSELGLSSEIVGDMMVKLAATFEEHCASVDITLPKLPEYLETYSPSQPIMSSALAADGASDRFKQFTDEIRLAVENKEPTASIVTTVMETLAWGLDFERVLLMLCGQNKRTLVGRMALGSGSTIDAKKIERPLGAAAGSQAPDAKAFSTGRPVFVGDPVLENGWPFVAMPIGAGARTIGVIYADRIGKEDQELLPREQAAITLLTELLERSLAGGG